MHTSSAPTATGEACSISRLGWRGGVRGGAKRSQYRIDGVLVSPIAAFSGSSNSYSISSRSSLRDHASSGTKMRTFKHASPAPCEAVPEFGACPSDAGASQRYWLLHLAILVLSKDTTVSLLTRYQTLLVLRGKVSRHCKAFTDATAHEFGVGSQQAEKVEVNMSMNYRVERN